VSANQAEVPPRSDDAYGMARVRAELADQGIVASRKCIAQMMRAAGLCGVSRLPGFKVGDVYDNAMAETSPHRWSMN